MRINKVILSSFLIALGFAAAAQNEQMDQSPSKVSFGLRAGFDYRNINGKDQNGDDLKFDMVPRFHGGLVVEIPLAKDFYVQPALLFAAKGGKADGNYIGLPVSTEFKLGYLEMPINFLYKPQLGTGNLLLGFGPYIALGITGEVENSSSGSSSSDKIEWTKEYSNANPYDARYIKPLDYGGNILFGYQFAGGFSAQLNAQLGLAQIKSNNLLDPSSQVEFKNTGFGISLGYMF